MTFERRAVFSALGQSLHKEQSRWRAKNLNSSRRSSLVIMLRPKMLEGQHSGATPPWSPPNANGASEDQLADEMLDAIS